MRLRDNSRHGNPPEVVIAEAAARLGRKSARAFGVRKSRGSIAAILALIAGTMLAGGPGAAQSTPQFRSSAHLVILDITVTDGADRPVSNLTRDDFTVLE